MRKMPRKTPVRELHADEESHCASPLRRSSRLASPGPSKLLQRRNSASEDSPAKLSKVKRLSLSVGRELDTISKSEEKQKENGPDTPRKSTRVTRSSSKSPSSLPGETESKSASIRTRSRTGSISKILEEEISSEHEEDMNHKSSKTEKSAKETGPSKPKARRSSITDKVVSLEVIEESPKAEPRSKTATTKKLSLKPITELGSDTEEAPEISSQAKNIKTDVENNESTVKENAVDAKIPTQSSDTEAILPEVTTNGTEEPTFDKAMQEENETQKISPVESNESTTVKEKSEDLPVDTKIPRQSSDTKAILPDVTTNGTEESTFDKATQEENETESCKISPVVILNSIEKQMNYSGQKLSLKKVDSPSTKDEIKPVKTKSPIVILQSIEKIISKHSHESNVESDECTVIDKNAPSAKEKLKGNDKGENQSLDQTDELRKNDENVSVISKDKHGKSVESIQSEKDVLTGKDDTGEDIITMKETCEKSIEPSQSDKSAEAGNSEATEDIIVMKEIHDKSVEPVQSEKDAEIGKDETRKDIIIVEAEIVKESVQLIRSDAETANDETTEDIITMNETCEKSVQPVQSEKGAETGKKVIITVKETKDNISEDQSLNQKVDSSEINENGHDTVVTVQKVKQNEINELITTSNDQRSEISKSVKENKKDPFNQCSITDGSDGSFNMSLPDLQLIETSGNKSICVDNLSNISENVSQENKHFNDSFDSSKKEKEPQANGTESSKINTSDNDLIKPKQNLTITKETDVTLPTEETEQSSFFEPMEIEYTDFNSTINSSVTESKDEENSSLRETTNSNKVDAKNAKEEANLDTHVIDQNKLQVESTIIKQTDDAITDNVRSEEELLNGSKSASPNSDVTENCNKSVEDSINKTNTDSIELEQSGSEKTKQLDPSTRKSISFAFNLDEEQFLSDEDINNKNPEEKNDNEEIYPDRSELEKDVVKNANDDILEEDESPAETKTRTVKSPSPVFSVDENQCLSDNETEKNNEINEEQNMKPKELQLPNSSFTAKDSENTDKVDDAAENKNEQEAEIVIETEEANNVNKNEQITEDTNIETDNDKIDCNSEKKNDTSQSELKENEAAQQISRVNEKQSSDLEITVDQHESVEVPTADPEDDTKLVNKEPEYWKSSGKKLNKKRRKSNIEDNLTSTVRTLIENVDDLDAKVDALIEKEKESNNLDKGESDDEISQNSFIDDMAEEGEEDTPSEGSNDIPVEGESLDSVDTTSGSDGSYEQDSFIDDDEENSLLSGEEDFLEGRKLKIKKGQGKLGIKKMKKIRIISDSESDEVVSENKTVKLKSAEICDSDDKMSTDPYLGLTPPSHVSVQESSSDIDVRSINNENEIIINDNDNLKSLEAMKGDGNPKSELVRVTKASSIICLDSDEDAVFQNVSKPSSNKSNDDAKNMESEEGDLPLTQSPKSRSSLNIQESIKLEDVEDGTLTNKICGIVDFFYSNIKESNVLSGTVSLNVSLDFADNISEKTTEAETSNIENIKIKPLKKRHRKSTESFSEKATSSAKRMKYSLSLRDSVSNEVTSTPVKISPSVKRTKRNVVEFDVEPIDVTDASVTTKSKSPEQKKLLKQPEKEETEELLNVSNKTVETKHLIAEENLADERKKNKNKEKKLKKIKKASSLIDADKENEETLPQEDIHSKKHKHKKIDEIKDEINESDIPPKKDKKKKKKSKHLLKPDEDNTLVDVIKPSENNDIKENKNRDKIHKKKESDKQEISVQDENESNDKIRKKKKSKLMMKSDEIETKHTDTNKNAKQKKKNKSKTTDENSTEVINDIRKIKQTKLNTEMKKSERAELISKEKTVKSKLKRKHAESDEDKDELKSANNVSSKPENETHLKSKKRYATRNYDFNINGTEVKYFRPHNLRELSTEVTTSTQEVRRKGLLKKPTFSSHSDSWTSIPLKTAISPSKKNHLHSVAGTSQPAAKKHKLQEESETFSSKDFKNRMLYDSSRVKRMPSKELLKSKMNKKFM